MTKMQFTHIQWLHIIFDEFVLNFTLKFFFKVKKNIRVIQLSWYYNEKKKYRHIKLNNLAYIYKTRFLDFVFLSVYL